MTRCMQSIDECLNYLKENKQSDEIIKNIESKLKLVSKYVNKEEKIDGLNVWLYKREPENSGFGFCLLKDKEPLGKNATRNFIAIKPKSINQSDYFNGKKFEKINKDFLNLSPKEFADKFLKAAEKRAVNKPA